MACTKKREKKSENVVFCWLSKRILLILLSSCGRLLTNKKNQKTSHSQPKLVFFSCRARCQVSLQSPDRYFPLGEVTSTLSAQRHLQAESGRLALSAGPRELNFSTVCGCLPQLGEEEAKRQSKMRPLKCHNTFFTFPPRCKSQ